MEIRELVIRLCPVSLLQYSVQVAAHNMWTQTPRYTQEGKKRAQIRMWEHPHWFGVVFRSAVSKWLVWTENFFIGGASINLFLRRKQNDHTSEIKHVITHAERTTPRCEPHVLLSAAFTGASQTSSGGAVIRQTRVIIPQVAKTASFIYLFIYIFLPQRCPCPFWHSMRVFFYFLSFLTQKFLYILVLIVTIMCKGQQIKIEKLADFTDGLISAL